MRGGAVVEDAAVGRAGGGGGGMVARRQLAAWAGARGRRAVLAVLGQLQRAVQPLGQVDAPQPTARRHLYTDAQVHLHTYLCVCVVYLSQMHRYTTHTHSSPTPTDGQTGTPCAPGARSTKYLTTILRLKGKGSPYSITERVRFRS